MEKSAECDGINSTLVESSRLRPCPGFYSRDENRIYPIAPQQQQYPPTVKTVIGEVLPSSLHDRRGRAIMAHPHVGKDGDALTSSNRWGTDRYDGGAAQCRHPPARQE